MIPHDKALHFIAGSLGALFGIGVALYFSLAPFTSAVVAGVILAVGKEVVDAFRGGPPDFIDLLATLAGAVPVWLALSV